MSSVYWFVTGLLQPVTFLLVGLGVLIFWPQPTGSPRRLWLKTWYLLVYLSFTPLFAYSLTAFLERPFPHDPARPDDLDVIIVLGGGTARQDADPNQFRLDHSSLRRCQRAAEYFHQGPACAVIVTGGVSYTEHVPVSVAEEMSKYLVQLGVPAENIHVEAESQNTEQNARFSAQIMRDQGWTRAAMVTTATHLMRSQRLFQQQGIEAIPVGSSYRTAEFEWNAFAFFPRERALNRQHEALHEILGMAWLIVRGRW